MLPSVLFVFLMVANVVPDSDVCDGESEDCDDKPKSVFLSQKSEYISGVQGNYEPSDNIDFNNDHGEGPGAGGQPVHLSGTPGDMNKYGMSEAVSDLISLSRNIPDTRNTGCRHWHYPSLLPSVSVVLVFHNEALSVLLRTVVSIISRSPPHILTEVLLVDDFSDLRKHPKLKNELESWVSNQEKVRLRRNDKREGLIRSKNIGAKLSFGEVVVFLDAHCEVNVNWLPPLLAPIVEDRNTVVVPIVDKIDHTTFEYSSVYDPRERPTGIWEWGFLYKELRGVSENQDEKFMSSSYPSPIHAGGLIAVNKDFFLSLGGYDPGLLVWGGEQYELSFKAWMCGGRVVWAPCSRVGHVYRALVPYTMGAAAQEAGGGDLTVRNLKRVVEVWLDEEHKQLFYTRQPLHKYLNIGNISGQMEFRKKCKPFSWFMSNIGSLALTKYPRVPPNKLWGLVRLEAAPQVCWRPQCGQPPCLVQTSRDCDLAPTRDEVLRLDTRGQLGLGERCIVPEQKEDRVELAVQICESVPEGGSWDYNENERRMEFTLRYEDEGKIGEQILCVEIRGLGGVIGLTDCDNEDMKQKWTWEEYKPYWA